MKKVLLFFILLAGMTEVLSQNRIIIFKDIFKLCVINPSYDTLFVADIGLGKHYGNKQRHGDCKTPEGEFKIIQIQSSSGWFHDFHDGKGLIKGAYGPYFIRLDTPITKSIGIHGTCYPETIGTRSSEGCIRLRNEDIKVLVELVNVGDVCVIHPDYINDIP